MAIDRKEHKKLGLCSLCSRTAVVGQSLCQYHKDARKRKIEEHLANGLCAKCKNPTENGKYYCEKHSKIKYEEKLKLYSKRESKGLCKLCDNPALFGYKLCTYHLDKNLENLNTFLLKKVTSGTCYRCDKPATNKNFCEEHLSQKYLYRRNIYKYRKENNLCVLCGLEITDDQKLMRKSITTCLSCAEIKARYEKKSGW